MTLSDIDRWDVTHAMDQIVQVEFRWTYVIMLVPSELEQTNSAGQHVERSTLLGVSHALIPRAPLPESFSGPQPTPIRFDTE